jgi:hypothetical protein
MDVEFSPLANWSNDGKDSLDLWDDIDSFCPQGVHR